MTTDCDNCTYQNTPACIWGGRYKCGEYKPRKPTGLEVMQT